MVFDDRIHFRHMQLRAFTIDARHVLVDLDDEPFGAACNLRRIIVASAEAHIAVTIHWRDGANKRVDTDVLGEQPDRLMKVRRHVTTTLRPPSSMPRLMRARSTADTNMLYGRMRSLSS